MISLRSKRAEFISFIFQNVCSAFIINEVFFFCFTKNVCNISVIINIVCNLLIENILEIPREETNQLTMIFLLFIVKHITEMIFTYLGWHYECSKCATNINH